jgi:Zn-dependent protease
LGAFFVLLGEPPQTAYDLNFSLFGIPVRVHPLFWLVTLLMGWNRRDPAAVLTWVVAVFIAILIHEMGHALVMRAYGYRPWITLYGMGGLASHNDGYDHRSKGAEPLAQILTSLAGPAAGFAAAAVLIIGFFLAGYGEGVVVTPLGPYVLGLPNPRLADLTNSLLFICVVWGVINLLPIYPLDGGQITREILLTFSPREGMRQSLVVSIAAAATMAAVGFVYWQSMFVAILFAYLAYSSYATLQAYGGRHPW